MTIDRTRGRAIVTYGRSLMALTIAESLGARGVEVIGADDVGLTVLSFSRYARRNFVHAPAATDPEGFIRDLEAAAIRYKPEDGRPYVLIPSFEETRLIARYAGRLSRHITVAAPAFAAIEAVDPKDHLMRTLRGLGLRAPATCTSAEWRAGGPHRPAGFPVMVKPFAGVGGRGVRRIEDSAALEAAIAAAEAAGETLLIQDFIGGEDYCLAALFDRGGLRASAAYLNLSQFPRAAGAGVLRETVPDAPFLPAVEALFEPLGWTGVAEIDFRWDGVTPPWLIEVNPRFWGGLFHTVESGVDFPWMLFELASTGQVAEHPQARLGQRTQVAGLYLLSAIQGIADSDTGFAAVKAAWGEASERFKSGRLLDAACDLARAVTAGFDVSKDADRLRVALALSRNAPDEMFRSDDPLVCLGALFIVASLLRHGRLPPELKYDPMGRDLTVE